MARPSKKVVKTIKISILKPPSKKSNSPNQSSRVVKATADRTRSDRSSGKTKSITTSVKIKKVGSDSSRKAVAVSVKKATARRIINRITSVEGGVNKKECFVSKSSFSARNSRNKLVEVAVKKDRKIEIVKEEIVKKPPSSRKKKDVDLGNSDDEGSVDSACLDENICFGCGLNTIAEMDWEELILCDVCDAEYHLRCVGLDALPRRSVRFICPKCQTEREYYSQLKFSVTSFFKLPRAPRDHTPQFCYSPSRKLELAWEECIRKGFMCVAEVFPFDIMTKLTNGVIEKHTTRGRLAETWNGASEEIVRCIKGHSNKVADRDGRYDIKLPRFVVDELKIECLLEPILTKLRTIMGTPSPIIRTHNVVFVPVGSLAQRWHCDDTYTECKTHRYFTILINLNALDSLCGGTEIYSKRLGRGDMIRPRPGDAFVFNGGVLHRGQTNQGYSHRFFYYASFACREDANLAAFVDK